jgi:serine/threonine protein kinase
MGLNLDSGELIAVKQVCIAQNNVTKDRAQAHIRELEEEVKLLQNLSHPNIVRYLGTAREEEALNIFLEFVPGGSISSLLGKFGSFTETVIRMYTRQLLLGLEYLHSNRIMHRDIKGANILVDNKGCIKLADFGASKKVVELATISEAKSMKGTPYWMAPEVIRQTGHNWQADMWSVGCTVIEMATGKPPWSQQFQEVAALFHIGTTKSHPPIPEHLSADGKDFLLKLLQREPRRRPSASEMLKHPFVENYEVYNGQESGEGRQMLEEHLQPTNGGGSVRTSMSLRNSLRGSLRQNALGSLMGSFRPGGVSFSFKDPRASFKRYLSMSRGGNTCGEDVNCSVRLDSVRMDSLRNSMRLDSVRDSVRLDSVRDSLNVRDSVNVRGSMNWRDSVNLDSVRLDAVGRDTWSESFNPVSEPSYVDGSRWRPNMTRNGGFSVRPSMANGVGGAGSRGMGRESMGARGWSLRPEDEEEVTESKIRAFLDEKALELKKLQTPLYEEFNDSLRGSAKLQEGGSAAGGAESAVGPLSPGTTKPSTPSNGSGASGRGVVVRSSEESESSVSSDSPGGSAAPSTSVNVSPLREIPSPRLNEMKAATGGTQGPSASSCLISSERQRLWKEELQQELELKREEKRKQIQRVAPLSPSPTSRAHQRPGSSRLATVSQV